MLGLYDAEDQTKDACINSTKWSYIPRLPFSLFFWFPPDAGVQQEVCHPGMPGEPAFSSRGILNRWAREDCHDYLDST